MKIALLLCAVLSAGSALPPRPPSSASPPGPLPDSPPADLPESPPDHDPTGPPHTQPADPQYSDSVERQIEAIETIFGAISGLSESAGGSTDLLDKLHEIALASVTDTELSFEERNAKYSAAMFDVLQEYANTIANDRERNSFLAILALSKNMAQSQAQPPAPAPDRAAFLAYMESLFDVAHEPPPRGTMGLRGDRDRDELDKQNFLAVLDSVLDDIYV